MSDVVLGNPGFCISSRALSSKNPIVIALMEGDKSLLLQQAGSCHMLFRPSYHIVDALAEDKEPAFAWPSSIHISNIMSPAATDLTGVVRVPAALPCAKSLLLS